MDPDTTIKLIQDTNWWTLAVQALSASAIIFAAYIAGSYQKKKDKKHKKKMETYYYSVLKQFQEQCDTLDFFGYVLGMIEKDLLESLSDDIIKSRDMITKNFIEIVEFCPSDVIHNIHMILTFINTVFIGYKNFEVGNGIPFDQIILNFHKIWEDKLKQMLDDTLTIIEKDLKPCLTRNISLAIYRRKKRRADKLKK